MKRLAFVLLLVGCAHKQAVRLIMPAPPFSIEVQDPRESAAHEYVSKQRASLREDLTTYPALRSEIQSLLVDADELNGLDVADPTYPEKFTEFHASLIALWRLEQCDAI